MPFNLLLLPLLGGYWFITRWNYSRPRVSRHSGERLIFGSAFAGVVLLTVSRFVVEYVATKHPDWVVNWQQLLPYEYSGTSIGALILGLVSPYVLNRFMPRDWANRRAMMNDGNFFELLLDRAMRDKRQVSVTLESGKVYIGYVAASFDPAKDRKYVALIPTVSGYRESETHDLVLTTNYTRVLDIVADDSERLAHLTREDFQVVLPVDSIRGINIFDEEAYRAFHPQARRGRVRRHGRAVAEPEEHAEENDEEAPPFAEEEGASTD